MKAAGLRQRLRGRWGLTARVAMASALLCLLIGGVFAFLVQSIIDVRDAAVVARRSERVLAAANDLERVVVDLETGQRGYLLTHDRAFLAPWQVARSDFDRDATELRLLTANHPAQERRADEITREGRSYIRDYSDPTIRSALRDPSAPVPLSVSVQGKNRVDAMRSQFDAFIRDEQRLGAERTARSRAAAHRAVVVAVCGTVGSIMMIAGFGGHLTRRVVRPIRRASRMAGAVALGDLGVRLRETGKAEIGHLERSMNTMAGSLERNRDELIASRARVVAAGDAARRRIERDLHDGTQQRLVTIALELRMAEQDVPRGEILLRQRLSCLVHEITDVVEELREISHGIHPAVLSQGGVAPAIATLARRSPIPVETDVRITRSLPEPVQVATYYVVSEALTNAAKHSRASCVRVEAVTDEDDVRLTVVDNGVGGADPDLGSGLIGLRDRVEALGGTIDVVSPVGGGTMVSVWVPVG